MFRLSRAAVRRTMAAAGIGVLLVTILSPDADPATAGTTGALLRGRLIDAAGHVDTGMTVTVTAWPNAATLAALPVGATVPTKTVSVAHPDGAGNYAITPGLATLDASYKERGGAVALEVTATDTDLNRDSTSYNFVAAQPGTTAASNPQVATTTRPQTIGLNLHSATVSVALGMGATTSTTNATTTRSAVATTTKSTSDTVTLGGGGHRRPPGCYAPWTKVKNYFKRAETFMSVWTAGAATVTEEIGSSHSVGVGVAVTGGGWTASGSTEIESHQSSGGDDTYYSNRNVKNYVNYAHYTQKCTKYSSKTAPNYQSYYKHRVSSTGLHSLLVGSTAIGANTWGGTNWKAHCTLYTHAGKHLSKSKGSGITYSAGIDAPFISLSAHASFTKDTSIIWTVPKGGAYFCGSSSAGPVSSAYAGMDKKPGPARGCSPKCQVVAPARRGQ